MQSPRGSLCRLASLVSLGALAVHQLRYALVYGSHSSQQLVDQGHGYLLQAIPAITGMALAVLVAGLIRAMLTGQAKPRTAAAPQRRWISYATGILAVFAAQELLEGALFAGHPAGAAALLANGGWLAFPLAALAGLLVVLADGWIADFEAIVATVSHWPGRRAPRTLAPAACAPIAWPCASPLAFGLASRPPPSFVR